MPPAPNPELRQQVIAIYKRKSFLSLHALKLLYLGRDYPQGYDFFRPRLHRAFMANANLTDEGAIRAGIARADFVRKEIEALYYLKRYRTLRKRYDGA